MIPIQIRLLPAEQMQIELPGRLIIFPRRASKTSAPVVGRRFVIRPDAVAPDIIIPVRVCPILPALLKPRVLVRRVIDNQIHQHLDSTVVKGLQHLFPICQRTEFIHDVAIIADIVAVVVVWRFVAGRQPYGVYAELLQIISLLQNAV